jgi:hypothetical protein
MANITITQLPSAGPLAGTESVPIVQNGQTVQTTVAAISSAPNQQQTFLTQVQEATLPNSRYLSTGIGLGVTDGGAQSYLRLNLNAASGSLETALTGIVVKDGSASVIARTILTSGSGLSITNGSGILGNPTLSLTGLVLNLANSSGAGFISLNGTGGLSPRQITGTATQIDVANGTGAGGNPVISMADTAVAPGTYGSSTQIPVVTVDAKGRITTATVASAVAGGTVTSVAALTLGTSGTDLSSTVANPTTTPVITLNVPTASAINRGALSAADWTTFNSKGSGTITDVTGTAPVVSSGGTTPAISMPQATTSVDGYLSATDWTTFNNKGSGTVTSVTGTAPVVSSGGATPAISMPAATGSVNGYLTSADWTTFNAKQPAGTYVNSVSGTAGRITSTGGVTPVIDLASGIASAGTTGSATLIPVVTIDTYGRVTTITTAANPQGTVTSITAGTGLSGGTITSAGTIAIDATVATLTGTQTLTNKTISGASNTLTNIGNSSLTNSAVTIGTTSISLGSSSLTLGGLTSVALTQDPVSALQAATKQYVDSVAQGLDPKASCVAATTINITLSAAQTIDGIALIAGDRCLVKNQTAPAENGIYLVASGAWTRTTDMDVWAEVPGAFTFIEQGTTQADTGWVCTSNAGGTIGTTAITFVQFAGVGSYTAGTGLTLTGTQFSLTSPVAVSLGGTGSTTAFTQYGVAYGSTTSAMATTTAGTSTQLLHGNASGAPTWSAVSLTADVSGTLPIANGGTNSTATATSGGVGYGTGTAHAYTAVGTTGQVLTSAGAGAPTWTTPTTGTVTSVTGTAPVVSSGGNTPAISMAAATTSVNGYLTSTDWTTFNNKGSGSVTSVSFTGGLITVATATTTPALTVAGTSGGIPYFSSASTWATSAALTANAIVLGGGAGAAPSVLASLGTTSTVLHGNAAGAPTFGAVSLTADVSGTLPIANGGTNSTATATAGGAGYGTGTAHAYTAAGTAGQVLTSAGASAPTWSGIAGGTF